MIRPAIAAVKAIPLPRILCLAGLALICAWAYWPTLGAMAGKWLHDPQYAHGYLVPFFSIFLLWRRRALLSAAARQCNWWGVLLVAAGAGLHVAGAYFYFDWLDAFSLLPCLAGFCVLLGGWRALRWAWPAIAFLLFMIPLPFRVETAFGLRLQSMATLASTYTLQAIGLPALSEGNTILLPGGAIGVAEACSGLSMLTTFFALATAVALVVRRPLLDKIVILLSAAPIAVAANVARITATALAQEWVGRDLAHHVFHELAGWLMMPVALALLWVELRLLAFLLVESQADAPMAVVPSPVLPAGCEKRVKPVGARRRKKAPPLDPRVARPL